MIEVLVDKLLNRVAMTGLECIEYRQMLVVRRDHLFGNLQRDTPESREVVLHGTQHVCQRLISAVIDDQRVNLLAGARHALAIGFAAAGWVGAQFTAQLPDRLPGDS